MFPIVILLYVSRESGREHFVRTFEHEKAFHKMGAAMAPSCPKTRFYDVFQG